MNYTRNIQNPFLDIIITMRIIAIFLLISLSFSLTQAQTIADLQMTLDTSKVEYTILEKDDVETLLEKSEPLPAILCRKKVNGNNKTTYFRLYGENDINFNKAEQEMDTLLYAEARAKYLILLDSFPDDTYLMTRVGSSYENENNDKEALVWYRKTLDGNDIAFDARRRIAGILAKDKELRPEALDHIIKASIINRNDDEVETMLQKVAQLNKSKYKGWEFKTQTFISTNEDKSKINVNIEDKIWKNYALSQATYLFEPNYKDSVMVRTDELLTITPYRESLMVLYETIRKKRVKDPMLVALKKAMKLGMLEEFMTYEIFLPMDAYTLFVLDDKQKERLYQYVKEVKLCLKK